MFAVVQIGSNDRRSPCMTARTVLLAAGRVCARTMPGAPAKAAAATPPFNTIRRDVDIACSLLCFRPPGWLDCPAPAADFLSLFEGINSRKPSARNPLTPIWQAGRRRRAGCSTVPRRMSVASSRSVRAGRVFNPPAMEQRRCLMSVVIKRLIYSHIPCASLLHASEQSRPFLPACGLGLAGRVETALRL